MMMMMMIIATVVTVAAAATFVTVADFIIVAAATPPVWGWCPITGWSPASKCLTPLWFVCVIFNSGLQPVGIINTAETPVKIQWSHWLLPALENHLQF